MSPYRRMQIDPYFSPYTKLKYKWINDLNINSDILNLIEEKVGNNLRCIGTGKKLPKQNTNNTDTDMNINNRDLMKLKILCKSKNIINRTKWWLAEWEKIFTNPISERGLIYKYIKNSRNERLEKKSYLKMGFRSK